MTKKTKRKKTPVVSKSESRLDKKYHKKYKRLPNILSKLPMLLFFTYLILGLFSAYGYFLVVNSEINGFQPITEINGVNLGDGSLAGMQAVENNLNELGSEAEEEGIFEGGDVSQVAQDTWVEAHRKQQEIIEHWGVGSIYIPNQSSGDSLPDIIVQSPILVGMSDYNMVVGLGTYTKEQRLGKGNYVVMAHSLANGTSALNYINSLNPGDTMYATDFNRVYEYEISHRGVVNETEMEWIEQNDNLTTPLLTIYRCEGGVGTPLRMLVQGELTNYYPASSAEESVAIGLGLLEGEKEKEAKDTKSKVYENNKTQPAYSKLGNLAIDIYLFISSNILLMALSFLLSYVIIQLIVKQIAL